ncbi:Receptor-type tyrosine-protein phosphatase U [Amphibalanus amphitrite]|uniref:Receptor-type tyrosine-protein phosphatase U n=1 Tax=Amphibalanus amphitrite TaxID=1232801 RepID=A0A6A4WJR4_AMPAM|nr:Receptor-type tyrosine-protein phosphatase U [Amphibalanus amphitrite]
MRQSRRGLIETIDQYKFVYDTLEEFVTCGYSSFPVSELSQRLKEKAVKGPDKLNDYQREFNQICRQVPKFTIGDCAGGHRADNRHKNRDVMIVPPDNFRPYLTSFQGTSATDYINAVFVDNKKKEEHKNEKKEEHKNKKKEEHKNKKEEGHKKKKKKEHMIKEERVFKKEHKNQEEHVYKKKEHKIQEHVYKKKEHKIQEHVYKKKEHKIQEHVYKKKEHTNKEEKHKIKKVNEGEQAGMSLELSSTGTPHRLS